MRHSRSDQFERFVEASTVRDRGGRRWHDDATDPSAPAALARRAAVLRAAWREPVASRLSFLEDRCRGRSVLDIGCVAHGIEREQSEGWLHGRLAKVAADCIGVDVLADEVAELNRRGYHVVAHDLAEGLGPLAPSAPFDVIVAGELIEHVHSIDMLFAAARAALSPDGELVLTTPNPYAPHRVRAGRLGIVWENSDHVMYAFPSGIAELAERHGLVLTEAMTCEDRRPPRNVRARLMTLRRRITGKSFVSVGYASLGRASQHRVRCSSLAGALHGLALPRRRFTGETFIYVVRRPRTDLQPHVVDDDGSATDYPER